METIRLYRGDYTKIKSFNVSKTNKFCLLGRGIYLTDSIKVAESYRTKTGLWSRASASNNTKLGTYKTENKGQAQQALFSEYFTKYWLPKYRGVKGQKNTNQKKYEKEAMRQYCFDLEDGVIDLKKEIYTSSFVNVTYFSLYLNDDCEKVGFITVFDFDLKLIEDATVKFDKENHNSIFKELTEAHQIPWTYSNVSSSFNNYNVVRGCRENAALARKYFKPYGFIGCEYSGGIRVRGMGYHRAFVIWDEDLVNQYRVNRFR